MGDTGFVYILINPSMEGLVKVGKTTREPKERADELSKATGVPTPFIVAYELAVHDCTSAEAFVHTYLEAKGYRVSSNREFFDAPLNIAIDAILEYKTTMGNLDTESDGYIQKDEQDNNLKPVSNPWDEFEMNAHEYRYGWNDCLQSNEKALELYRKAVKLGSPTACSDVGAMYERGEGCIADTNKALEYYQEGAKRGDNNCNAYMMQLYFEIQHIDNAQKCWNRYIDKLDFSNMENFSYSNCCTYLQNTRKYNVPIERLDILEKMQMGIWNEAIKQLNQWISWGARPQMIQDKRSFNAYVKKMLKIEGVSTSTGGGTGCLLPILGLLLIGLVIVYI